MSDSNERQSRQYRWNRWRQRHKDSSDSIAHFNREKKEREEYKSRPRRHPVYAVRSQNAPAFIKLAKKRGLTYDRVLFVADTDEMYSLPPYLVTDIRLIDRPAVVSQQAKVKNKKRRRPFS